MSENDRAALNCSMTTDEQRFLSKRYYKYFVFAFPCTVSLKKAELISTKKIKKHLAMLF